MLQSNKFKQKKPPKLRNQTRQNKLNKAVTKIKQSQPMKQGKTKQKNETKQ